MNAKENDSRKMKPVHPLPGPECLSVENLSAELDGEYHFSPEEQQHLAHCDRCRNLYESYRVVDDALTRALMVNCPRDAAFRIRKSVNRRLDRMAPMHVHKPIRFSAFAAKIAAIVVFAAMAGYLVFIDNPYFDDPSEVPCPVKSSAAAKRNIPADSGSSAIFPGGVDIRNLRLAAAGEPAAFRFTEPSAASVKAEHAAEIPESVKHVWLFNSAGKTEKIEKPLRNALEAAGVPLDQVRIAATPEHGLRVNLQLTRRQCVMLTRQLAAQQFQLVSPTQPQPEQRLFAGTGEELVEYEAVLLPRG